MFMWKKSLFGCFSNVALLAFAFMSNLLSRYYALKSRLRKAVAVTIDSGTILLVSSNEMNC